MSNTINLADLIKIEELNNQKTSLSDALNSLQSEIQNIKQRHPEEIEKLKTEIREKLIRQLNLEQEAKSIEENHTKEIEYKTEIASKISNQLNKILNDKFYTNKITEITKHLDAQKQIYTLAVSADNLDILPNEARSKTKEIPGSGLIRIISDSKTYILDQQEIKTYLLNQIINNTVENLVN